MIRICKKYFTAKKREYLDMSFHTKKSAKHHFYKIANELKKGHYWIEDEKGRLKHLDTIIC